MIREDTSREVSSFFTLGGDFIGKYKRLKVI